MPAVTRDIADAGNAIAEHIDADLAGDAAQQLMTLLLSGAGRNDDWDEPHQAASFD